MNDIMKVPTDYVYMPFSENLFCKNCGCVPYEITGGGTGRKYWTQLEVANKWNECNRNNRIYFDAFVGQWKYLNDEL